MATITSAGTGSGVDFESIISAMVSQKKTQLNRRTTQMKNNLYIEESGVNTLKSGLSSFQSVLNTLSGEGTFSAKKVTTNQGSAGVFDVTTEKDAGAANYNIAVTQLAKSERSVQRFQVAEEGQEGFHNSFEAGTLTFSMGEGDDEKSFSIEVEEGDTLDSIRKKLDGNSLGVTASLVETSTGFTFSLDTNVTGDSANSLKISSSGGNGNGDSLSMFDKSGVHVTGDDGKVNQNNWNIAQKSQDAVLLVDGDEVHSSTNVFDQGQIAGLKLTVNTLSPTASSSDSDKVSFNGTSYKTYKVGVESDADGIANKVQSFVTAYNTIIGSLDALYKHNTYTDGVSNEDGGDLAGDASVYTLRNNLQNMISGFNATEDGKTIFNMGISYEEDGTLSFNSVKFKTALSESPTAVENLLSGDDGIITKMNNLVTPYTKSSGILSKRLESINSQQKTIENKIDSNTEALEKYEANLRDRYGKLDSLMASYNTSLSYLSTVLTSLSASTKSSK